MKTPRVEFRYSWIYDSGRRTGYVNFAKWRNKRVKYPSNQSTLNYLKKNKSEWRKVERKVFRELQSVTGLRFKSDMICYIVGGGKSISDPFTVSTHRGNAARGLKRKTTEDFMHTILHESIHNLFRQNKEKLKNYWKYVWKKYRASAVTRRHIPLHAIHAHIYLKLFNEDHMKREVKRCQLAKDYAKSWEIVQKEGPENIIKEFKKRI